MSETKNYVVSFRAYQVVAVPVEEVEEPVDGIKVWNKAREKINAFDWDHEDEYEAEAIELITEDENGDELSVRQPFWEVPSSLMDKPAP
jgi:hypothetical protein